MGTCSLINWHASSGTTVTCFPDVSSSKQLAGSSRTGLQNKYERYWRENGEQAAGAPVVESGSRKPGWYSPLYHHAY